MYKCIQDNVTVSLGDSSNEIFIEVTDSVLQENIELALTYEEYRDIAKSFEYIEEMRKVRDDLQNNKWHRKRNGGSCEHRKTFLRP